MYVLSLDQGTTSTRAIVYDGKLQPVAAGQQEFTQHFPQPGWVEHEAEEIWQTALNAIKTALDAAEAAPSGYQRHWHHQSAGNPGCL